MAPSSGAHGLTSFIAKQLLRQRRHPRLRKLLQAHPLRVLSRNAACSRSLVFEHHLTCLAKSGFAALIGLTILHCGVIAKRGGERQRLSEYARAPAPKNPTLRDSRR